MWSIVVSRWSTCVVVTPGTGWVEREDLILLAFMVWWVVYVVGALQVAVKVRPYDVVVTTIKIIADIYPLPVGHKTSFWLGHSSSWIYIYSARVRAQTILLSSAIPGLLDLETLDMLGTGKSSLYIGQLQQTLVGVTVEIPTGQQP